MPKIPKLAWAAAIIAFIFAALTAAGALLGPIVVLSFALAPLFAGIGIIRRKFWSAYGFAIFSSRNQEPYVIHKTDYTDPYRDNFPNDSSQPLYREAVEMLKSNVNNGEVIVPAGKYFVLGDNRDYSLDSRCWGFVEASGMIGKPFMIYDFEESANHDDFLEQKDTSLRAKKPGGIAF